jgi:hypothetical protein
MKSQDYKPKSIYPISTASKSTKQLIG